MSRCAKTAECRVANHRSICLCPQGLQRNPKVECKRIECRSNSECEQTKSCIEGSCVNLCLLPNACGISAQCKSIRHKKKCFCPKNMWAIPTLNVFQTKMNVCQVLVDLMQYVQKEIVRDHVDVFLNTSGIHMWHAGQNVQ